MARRRFLAALLAFAATLLALAWGVLGSARRERVGLRRLTLASPVADGVSIERDVILVRRGNELRAFSSRCPHLGCRLNRVEAEQLVCPCHGSRFDLAGHRLTGPASADLTSLAVERKDDGRIEVVVPA